MLEDFRPGLATCSTSGAVVQARAGCWRWRRRAWCRWPAAVQHPASAGERAAARWFVREGTRGYDLLRLALAQDPLTGEAYPRHAPERADRRLWCRIGEAWEKWDQREARAVPLGRAWVHRAA